MKHKPPLKAIRLKCLDCCCQQVTEVKLCELTECPLWYYRFGKNPFTKKRKMTEEQKAASAENLNKARLARAGD